MLVLFLAIHLDNQARKFFSIEVKNPDKNLYICQRIVVLLPWLLVTNFKVKKCQKLFRSGAHNWSHLELKESQICHIHPKLHKICPRRRSNRLPGIVYPLAILIFGVIHMEMFSAPTASFKLEIGEISFGREGGVRRYSGSWQHILDIWYSFQSLETNIVCMAG